MKIAEILSVERTFIDEEIVSKKKLLEFIAEQVSQSCHLDNSNHVFQCLLDRERLGSTGLGEGIAIPHGRSEEVDHIVGVLVKTEHKINFDAIDNMPVDLFFGLVVPVEATTEHLQSLAALAELFQLEQFRARLREAPCAESLFDTMVTYTADKL